MNIDIFDRPRRPYDFSKGDRRFVDFDVALRHAEKKALETGIRQEVRPTSSPSFQKLWIVQAVGS